MPSTDAPMDDGTRATGVRQTSTLVERIVDYLDCWDLGLGRGSGKLDRQQCIARLSLDPRP